jgi:histone demethylase JARID1
LQRLNSIEASSRAKVNFLEQLYRYHRQQGNPRVSVPTINHKALDLWLLRKEVQKLGGYDEVDSPWLRCEVSTELFAKVSRNKKWADLGRILGYTGVPGLSAQIKNSYTRVILPYEHFCERVRNSPALSPIKGQSAQQSHLRTALAYQTILKQSNGNADVEMVSRPGSPMSGASSPLSEAPDDEYKRTPYKTRGIGDSKFDAAHQAMQH